jgi:O-antigen/teichoic acid export membrane protein
VFSISLKQTILTRCPAVLRPLLDRIEASDTGYRLARGAFWSFTGAVISRGLTFVASILVARILGRTGYGEVGMVQSTVGLFGSLAGFGMGLTATKHVAEFCQSDPNRAGRVVTLAGLVALLTAGPMALGLLALAPWLAVHTIGAPHLAGALRIGAGLLLLGALNGAQTGALAGFEAFKTIAQVNLLVGLISFPILVSGAYFGGSVGMVWALTINMGANWLLNHIALRAEAHRHGVPLAFRHCRRELPMVWSFSLPATLGSAMVVPVTWACYTILVHQPQGYGQLGVYSAIQYIKQIPEVLLAVLMVPLLPVLSERFAAREIASYNRTLSCAFGLSLGLIVPVSLLQTALPSLTLLFLGPDYQGNTAVVQWLMLHSMLAGLSTPLASVIASVNRMWFGFVYNFSWGLCFAGLTLLLAPRHGAVGLAAAFSAAYLLMGIASVLYIAWREKAFLAGVPLVRLTVLLLLSYGICTLTACYASTPIAAITGTATAALWGRNAFLLVLQSRGPEPARFFRQIH